MSLLIHLAEPATGALDHIPCKLYAKYFTVLTEKDADLIFGSVQRKMANYQGSHAYSLSKVIEY
jgi:hypothetical protein